MTPDEGKTQDLCHKDWSSHRAVLFLDPYGMQVEWTTIEAIARTGAIDLWLGGHTHTHPDDHTGGRTHIERKWGVNFANISALTRCHGHRHSTPMSRLLTFTDGSNQVRVQCYLHASPYRPQGWYQEAERVLELGKPFRMA